jgi:hypothetical protein
LNGGLIDRMAKLAEAVLPTMQNSLDRVRRASRDDRTRHCCRTKTAMRPGLRLKAAPPVSHFI